MQIPSADPVDPRLVTRLRAAGCVFAEDEARLLTTAAHTGPELSELVARRIAGTPLEYLLGWAEFAGLRIRVAAGVFVPRRRTELLARRAAELATDVEGRRPVVVDLCCGSGAIAAVVAERVAGVELHAAELDAAAVECARPNVAAPVHVGDLFAALPTELRGRVDVLVANVPYVPTEAIAGMPTEARDHENRIALDGGPDGLDVLRRVTGDVVDWLAPGGHLLVETSDEQSDDARTEFTAAGLRAWVETDDELGATIVLGRLA